MTDDEVLGGFQVSYQPTCPCEPSRSAPKGAEDAIWYPQKALTNHRDWRTPQMGVVLCKGRANRTI